jgi:hypothetical protein
MKKTLLKRHTFCLGDHTPDGESTYINTEFHSNGDPITKTDGIFVLTEITLNSYGSAATLSIGERITPKKLRELADELEKIEWELRRNK